MQINPEPICSAELQQSLQCIPVSAEKNKYPYALIECDEAAFKTVSKYVDAKCVVVTNVFRDQLDRYGEVTHTLNSILTGIKNSPNAVVCINADDSLSVSMKDEIPNKVVFLWALKTEIYKNRVEEVSDAPVLY